MNMYAHTHTHIHIHTHTQMGQNSRENTKQKPQRRHHSCQRSQENAFCRLLVTPEGRRRGFRFKIAPQNAQFRFLSRGACQHNRDSAGRGGGLCFIIKANYICAGRKQQSCVLWRMRMCVHMCIHMCVRLIHTCDSSHSLWVECIHSMNV